MKRYVLTKDKIIRLSNEYDDYDAYIDKTSDNILDLLEVGDCVELDNEWEILKVLRFNKDNEMVCMVRTSSSTEEYRFYEYRKVYIKAIWKRNGDIMRRYEVK